MQIPAGIVRVWRGLPNEGGTFQGTAFFIEPTRALTAAHVLEQSAEKPLYLSLAWNGGYYARVASQEAHEDRSRVDVALLIVDEQDAAPGDALIPVGDPLPIAITMPIVMAGFADAHTAVEWRPASVTSFEGASTAAIVQPIPARGMSGGPALSPDGLLRGVTWARDVDKGRGYVTPFSAFRQFLAAHNVQNVIRAKKASGVAVARAADTERHYMAQKLLLKWREMYGRRADELTAAAEKASDLQRKKPTTVDADTTALIAFAAEVARDLRELPVGNLEFAKSYGLYVHETVFWGQALDDAAHTDEIHGPGRDPNLEKFDKLRRAQGLPALFSAPDEYAYEMIGRVLSSAASLARFAPQRLPLGYASPAGGPEITKNLSDAGPLLLAHTGDGPSLKLLELGSSPRSCGTFAARGLQLFVYAAQRMNDGTLDILGHDFQRTYRWSASSSTPTSDIGRMDILAAAFASSHPGASPIVVAADGAARELFLDGSSNLLLPPLEEPCVAAALWQNPLDPETRHILRLSKGGTLSSTPLGSNGQGRSIDLTAHVPDDVGLEEEFLNFQGDELHLSELEGFSCAIVSLSLRFIAHRIVHFIHPETLQPIRQARHFANDWAEFRLANGRWLVATRIGTTSPRALLAIWDLTDPKPAPVGEWCIEAADIYAPRVVSAGSDDFHVYFTLRLLTGGHEYFLCRFRFSTGEIERLQSYPKLLTYPVSEPGTL